MGLLETALPASNDIPTQPSPPVESYVIVPTLAGTNSNESPVLRVKPEHAVEVASRILKVDEERKATN